MQGTIRIIGGEWRGRKLKVPDSAHLRPTPDRVRETVFNWLAPIIAGTYCLDAFAGSGALGFEALSRGATHVVMVDDSLKIIQLLQEEALLLGAKNAEIYRAKVPNQLKQPIKPFDIVFLDPPFSENLMLPTCLYLEEQHLLAANAYIYLESRETLTEKELPSNWQIIKSKRAGQVAYHLAQRTPT